MTRLPGIVSDIRINDVTLILRGLLLAVVGVVIWKLLQPRCLMRIAVNRDGVTSHHGIPAGKQSVILDFVARQIITDRPVTICVSRGSGRHPSIRFSGSLDDGTQQLVRNFLLSELI